MLLSEDFSMQPRDTKIEEEFSQINLEGEVAKITLEDCLACVGCVTTAETILL